VRNCDGEVDITGCGVINGEAQPKNSHKQQSNNQQVRDQIVLENLSLVDDLTGLYNRRGFMALAEHRVKLAYRHGEVFSIAFVDLDGLKQINDALGHQIGNQALVDAANVLKHCFRESDILARLGGDEFGLFIAEADHREIARRIQQKLHICNAEPGHQYQLSFSMGIVLGNAEKNLDITALLESADTLMYQQKRIKRSNRSAVDEK